MKKTINRSEVMQMAWQIKRQNQFLTFGQCQRQAWQVCRLKQAMNEGEARFTFQKTNGEVRQAIGTTKADLFNYDFKGSERHSGVCQVRYFDLEKSAWRSFRAERLLCLAA